MELIRNGKAILLSFKKNFPGKQKPALILISVFLLLLCIVFLFYLRLILNTSAVMNGVLVDGRSVGGYTREELSRYLEEHYAGVLDGISLKFTSPHFERNVSLTELGIRADFGAMVQKAYELGRTGNVLERLFKILQLQIKPEQVNLILDFDSEAFYSFLDDICRSVYQEVIPYNIVIMEERVILCTGISGTEADREKLRNDIMKAAYALRPAGIQVPLIKKQPPAFDLETAYNTLNKSPVNAEFIKTSGKTYEIKPHEMGRRISMDALTEIADYVENRENQDYEEIILPVELIPPEVTDEELEAQLFRDTLSSYTTHFTTGTQNNHNRGINIGLAAKSIDGTILLPGEEFSFNKTVGSRTTEKGYKIAHVFVEGQIMDGTGGGVCQVSTTLYNAVLRANLDVLERHNHMFTVGYVPLGMDAAVSYGYADLVFKNTTGYPLLIAADVYGNSLTFRICSVNDYPNLKVKVASEIIKKIPHTVRYIDDPSMPQGTAEVTDNGSDGYIVDTYTKIFNGDSLIRETKLHRSIYQMLPRKIKRGTYPVSEMVE